MRNTIHSVIAPEVIDPLTIGRARFCARRMHPRRDEGGHGAGAPGADPAGANPAGGGGSDPADDGGDDGKKFTQADVDRFIAGRFAKYADYDAIKTERDELKSATATAQEREIEKARKEGRDEVTTQATERLVRAESRGVAAELGFHNPGEAHLYIDLADVPMKDDDVDTAALKELLTAATKDRPYLLKDSNDSASHQDVGIGRRGTSPEPKPGTARLESAFNAEYSK
ncbi:hypothetical protein KKP62_10215 [Rhodococcus sp. GOMB7]|uniref:hypothetical protein n=1 Tax=Rhodococcus sp. GOMB7 TaxID=2839033 RepID=UPI001C000A4B|nr:hypothetical protein [Rhodococcus sp. GOMB7]MBT9295337.1 hypothetical protein [Rhodococcus sp. GOMB7]